MLAVCFDLDGNLISHDLGSTDPVQVEPEDTLPFQVNLFSQALSGQGCPAFLVAGAGTKV